MDINFIEALIYSVIPTLIATLITLYLTEKVKGNVKNSFDKKIEKIRKKHNLEIAKFQVDLNSLKEKENFKFTKLHEKRFEILEEIYRLLNEMLNDLNLYISPVKITPKGITFEEYEDQLQEKYINTHNKFVGYFSKNKIYLGEKIIELIDQYLYEVSETYSDYSQNHYLKRMGDKPDSNLIMKAATAYKRMPEKIYPIRKEIEKEFREILEQ